MKWADDNSRMLTWQAQRQIRGGQQGRVPTCPSFISTAIFIRLIRMGHFSGSSHTSDAEAAVFFLFSVLFDPKWFSTFSPHPLLSVPRRGHTPDGATSSPSSHFHYYLFKQECPHRAPVCQGTFKSGQNWLVLAGQSCWFWFQEPVDPVCPSQRWRHLISVCCFFYLRSLAAFIFSSSASSVSHYCIHLSSHQLNYINAWDNFPAHPDWTSNIPEWTSTATNANNLDMDYWSLQLAAEHHFTGFCPARRSDRRQIGSLYFFAFI